MKGVSAVFFILLFAALTICATVEDSAGENQEWLVESIRFKKMFPLFNSDIEPSLTFRRGSTVTEKKIEESRESIIRTMENRGLRDIVLRIETEKDSARQTIIITIIKEHSQRCRIKSININGNKRFSAFRLRGVLNAWKYRNTPLDKIEFSNDLNNITDKYNENAFADAKVSDSISESADGKSANIFINISEGKRYKLKITEKGALTRRQIKKELDFKKGASNRNDRIIKIGKKTLEKELSGLGYIDGTVNISDTTIEKKKKDTRKLYIYIGKGERVLLNEIKFAQNSYFTDEELLKSINSKPADKGKIKRNGSGSFVPKAIEDDRIIIENKYYQNGFFNVAVEKSVKESGGSAKVSIEIVEGKQTIISEINIIGEEFPLETLPLKTNSFLNPFAADSCVQIIKNFFVEKGFADTKVGASVEFNGDSSLAAVSFNINNGKKFTFGNINFVGNFKTKEKYIKKFIDIEEGDDFSNVRLLKNMQHLRKVSVFRSVSSEITTTSDSINNLTISFDEIYPYILNFSGGYNSEVLYYSKIKLTNRNFLGRNKIFSLGGGISAKEYSLDASFLEPYFFSEKLSLVIDLYSKWEEVIEEKFWSRAIGNGYGLSFRPTKPLSLGIKANYEMRLLYPFKHFNYATYETQTNDESINVSLTNKLRHTVSATPNILFDFRDSQIRPRKGGSLSSQVLVSHGFNSPADDFYKVEGEAKLFIPLSRFFTLAYRIGAGTAIPYGNNREVAIDRLFSVGGTRTIRGFGEGMFYTTDNGSLPVLAYSTIYNSAELRISLGAIEIPVFSDFGTITDRDKGEFFKWKYSYGSGVRYITPIGPVGIVYAVPFDKESRAENDARNKTSMTGVIHFSIGYSF